jgi:glycosyltransferase involved in cell wall biosynthesis
MHILVLDHESTDATAGVARANGAAVIVRSFAGFVEARRYARSQVRTPWTFMLDADEALDETLRQALLCGPDDADAYTVSRTTFYCGRALRMWRDERLLRLFKTDRAELVARPAAGGSADIHERWVCRGVVRELRGTLLHYSYPTREAYDRKYDRYTALEARGLRRSAGRALAESLKSPLRFLWYLIARGAILDGAAGAYVAWRSAAYPAVVQWKAAR